MEENMPIFDHTALLVLVLCLIGSTALGSAGSGKDRSLAAFLDRLPVPKDCSQIAFVTSDSWDTKLAVMRLYERNDGSWKPIAGAEWPLCIGGNGMGWGRGLMQTEGLAGPRKVEGDNKSPAGIYELGDAFGYSKEPPEGCHLHYRQATERDFFVDDTDSPDYNTWVRIENGPVEPEKRWKSFERMLLDNDLYKWGIVVKHNMSPVVAGKGCAIFIHLWGGPTSPTAGCTSMSEEYVLKLLRWFDPKKHPLLVQFPWSAISEITSPKDKAQQR